MRDIMNKPEIKAVLTLAIMVFLFVGPILSVSAGKFFLLRKKGITWLKGQF